MPPVRPGRASKACTACRRQKTRCYDSENSRGACLRCETLKQPCSLEEYLTRQREHGSALLQTQHQIGSQNSSTNERIARLEATVNRLLVRLDASSSELAADTVTAEPDFHPPPTTSDQSSSAAAPPVLLIRDVATEVGVKRGDTTSEKVQQVPDIIASGLITAEYASNLLSIFQEHYGRWVAFDEFVPVEVLMRQVRKSSLLLCSVCLIAVRHTTQELALRLAPTLFNEAKSLAFYQSSHCPSIRRVLPIRHYSEHVVYNDWTSTLGC